MWIIRDFRDGCECSNAYQTSILGSLFSCLLVENLDWSQRLNGEKKESVISYTSRSAEKKITHHDAEDEKCRMLFNDLKLLFFQARTRVAYRNRKTNCCT